MTRHSIICAVYGILSTDSTGGLFQNVGARAEILRIVNDSLNSGPIRVNEIAIKAAGKLIARAEFSDDQDRSKVGQNLAARLSPESPNELRILGARMIKDLAKTYHGHVEQDISVLSVPLVAGAKDKNREVKSASERALVHLLRIRSGIDHIQVTYF